MDRFEYKQLKVTLMGLRADFPQHIEDLNQAGAEGWEVISCVAVAILDGATQYLLYILKRKLP